MNPSSQQSENQFHIVAETNMDYDGMQSAKNSSTAQQGEESSNTASARHAHLDEKQKERWSDAVNSINFTHSSRLAWNTCNNLTGRSK